MRPVLVVNAGSSSVRFARAELDPGGARVSARARVDGNRPSLDALREFAGAGAELAAVAHRVVHGGPHRQATAAFDGAVEADVRAMEPLAPLHNPATLAWLALCRQAWPALPQLAVFDAGFFAGLPPVAATYPLPAELRAEMGYRRLGFHGLAHRSLWQAYCRRRPRPGARVISLQLGSGCSAAALRDGQPVDTSMGFTPLEGLMMRTRPGDLDPGILLHLVQQGWSAAELGKLLDERSGLAGVSGTGGDVRDLLASDRPEADLAIDLFCYRARKYLGAFLAALGGGEAILLGGGVAENAPEVRRRILGGLEDLGLQLDLARNGAVGGEGCISAAGSRIEAWVLPTDEETVMAEEAGHWLATTTTTTTGEAP